MTSGVKIYPTTGTGLPVVGETGALSALDDLLRFPVMGPDPDDGVVRAGAVSIADFKDYLVTETQAIHDATAAIYDAFDDRYLGTFASAPTTDNDGDALVAGAQYFNTSNDQFYVHNGTTWLSSNYVSTDVEITGGTIDGVSITDATADVTDLTVTGAIDATGATSIAGIAGRLLGVQKFTAVGANTYTKTPGTAKALVVLVGGGGGGGNANSNTSGTTLGAASGGGKGQLAQALLDVTAISTAAVTIGTGGLGATTAGANGNPGGDSTWVDAVRTLTAKGGTGGAGNEDRGGGYASARGSMVTPADNSAVSGHIVDVPPAPGTRGFGIVTNALASGGGYALGGDGADGPFGRGGDGGRVLTANSSQAGSNATGYGAGGGGGACLGNATNANGGDGGSAIALVFEYSG